MKEMNDDMKWWHKQGKGNAKGGKTKVRKNNEDEK